MIHHISVEVRGIAPLLLNAFPVDFDPLGNATKSATVKAQDHTPREQAERKLYREGDMIGIPGSNVYAALIDAGRFQKIGKSKMTTMKSTIIPGGINMVTAFCPIEPPDWEVDSRPVVVPSTGGRVLCHRPRFDKWSLSFVLELDTDEFSVNQTRKLVDDCGRKIGLADFRPSRKGSFGRFVVEHWQVDDASN